MRAWIDMALTGVTAVFLHPTRSVATIVALVSVLLPHLATMGLSRGLREQVEISLAAGSDLYVQGQQFGRPTPVPLAIAPKIRQIDGVVRVTPRIVGAIQLGAQHVDAVVMGLPRDAVPIGNSIDASRILEGRLFHDDGHPELVIGSDLARRLKLRVGDRLPPFYRNARGERVSEVVGIVRVGAVPWHSRLIFTSFNAAEQIFDQQGVATELLVDCRPGYEDRVRTRILQSAWPQDLTSFRPHVVTRGELTAALPRELLHRDGIFALHHVLLFSAAILVVVVTSGAGLTERRRETALLKAFGWQTDELLWRGLVESLVLGIVAVSLSVVLAWTWLELLNGWAIASLFLPGVAWRPVEDVPFRLALEPVVLSLIVSWSIVSSGTLWSIWRAAITSPASILR